MPVNHLSNSTFAAYTITVRHGLKVNEHLSKINGNIDLYDLLEDFLTSKDLIDIDSVKELRQCSDVFDDDRVLFGFFESGSYGIKGTIKRKGQGHVFDKTANDADMGRYYFHAYIPADSDTGFLIVETSNRGGILSVFQDHFAKFCLNKDSQLVVKIERVAPKHYIDALLNGNEIKSIKYHRTSLKGDEATRLANLGIHDEFGSAELIYKPKRNAVFAIMQKVKSYVDKSDPAGIVNLPGQGWDPENILITLKVNGRDRTVNIKTLGVSRPDFIADIERDEDGLTDLVELRKWSTETINDLVEELNT